MLAIKKLIRSFYRALVDTIEHDGVEHAGYLAFLSLLSFFPFLVFFFAVLGFVGESSLGGQFIEILFANIPERMVEALKPRIVEIASGPPQGLLTLAVVGAIWTASSAVEGSRTILNRAYRVATPPAYILRRLLSIAQFLILTAIVLMTMLGLILVPLLWEKIRVYLEIEDVISPVWPYIRYGLVPSILFLAVSMFYFVLPNIKQTWKSVAPGALVVVMGWIGFALLFAGYLKNFDQVNIIYGSLGGFIISLLFFYIMSMIFIYGAEFNYHYELSQGHRPQQKEPVDV